MGEDPPPPPPPPPPQPGGSDRATEFLDDLKRHGRRAWEEVRGLLSGDRDQEGPVWRQTRVVTLAVLAVIFVGAVIGAANVGPSQDELENARDHRDAARARADSLQQRLATAQSQIAEAEQRASETREQASMAEARAMEQAEQQLAERRQQLEARASELDQREAEISRQEDIAERSHFGSGVYEVGVDVVPGTYRAEGGSPCYWAKLSNDAEREIIDNHLGSGPQVVTLQGGVLFETEGCGEWQRS